MGYAITNLEPISEGSFSFIKNTQGITIITDKLEEIIGFEKIISFISGYVVDIQEHSTQQNVYQGFLSDIEFSWPLHSNFSGSYAVAVIYENEIILANDVIGPYPLFYYIKDDRYIFTDNLQWIKYFIEIELDSTGIAQRLWAPENSNIGSRTIIKGVKRLLPGEKLTFDFKSFEFKKEYDNRLFDEIGDDKIDEKLIRTYLNRLKSEINQLKYYGKSIDVALSGGLDSRLLLGVLPSNNNSTCFTYGPSDSYESEVAKKLAKSKDFKFIPKTDYSQYFPSKEKLFKAIENSDSPYIMAWFEFLKGIPKEKKILLIGDMCEALPARNIKKYSSRKDRKRNFFKHFLLNNPYPFEPSNSMAFHLWKSKIRNRYLDDVENYNFSSSLFKNVNKEIFLKEMAYNLEEIFKRIEAHNLKFVELYDELFTWFTHSRIPMGKQITHCNHKFKAISPSMGSGILILTSNIHPNARMNYRFMERLFKEDEFVKLNKISTSQSPLIPRNASKALRFLMWGFRSTVDQRLIRRILQNKNSNLRYRLFKGLNWVEVYQMNNVMEVFNTYFENNFIGNDIYENAKNLLEARINLSSWPLINSDIMAPAILNLEIESLMEQTKTN